MQTDCIDWLKLDLDKISSGLNNGYDDLQLAFDYMKTSDTLGPEWNALVSRITNLSRIDTFTNCIKFHRKNAKYFSIMKIFHIPQPGYKDMMVRNFLKLGFSQKFINEVLLYPSGRPVVDLSQFILSLGITPKLYIEKPLNTVNSPTYICILDDGLYNGLQIPVLRYQVGMAGYLTATPSSESFCGTFYYYDPSSPFLLDGGRTLVSWNKITACLDLGISINEVYDMLYQSLSNSALNVDRIELYNSIKSYKDKLIDPMIHRKDLYAKEDIFDQPLCVTASKMGINTVILKYMTGENRVVSELLDTRSRIDSFSNISMPE